ncbi:MAG: hypothetical protein Q9160_002860 [Pyrenula sp. 1 TL-2023]
MLDQNHNITPPNLVPQNFFVVMITPVLINRLGWKTYLIFMCTNLAFVPTIYFFYPETSNISLEGIDQIFLDKNRKPWHKAYVEDENRVAGIGDSGSEEGDREKEKEKGGVVQQTVEKV